MLESDRFAATSQDMSVSIEASAPSLVTEAAGEGLREECLEWSGERVAVDRNIKLSSVGPRPVRDVLDTDKRACKHKDC